MAVLAVVLTAPLGAVATSLLGPVLLRKANLDSSVDQSLDEDKDRDEPPSPKDGQSLFKPVPVMEPDLQGRSASYDGMIL